MSNIAAFVAGSALKAFFGETLETAASLGAKVREHFQAHGDILHQALAGSCEQAFRALEVALGGQTLLGWMVSKATASGDERATQAQLQAFLADHPLAATPESRAAMLATLRQARAAHVLSLPPGAAGLDSLLAACGSASPTPALPADLRALLAAPGPDSRPWLPAMAQRFFLLRVQSDERLHRSLSFLQQDRLSQALPAHFAAQADMLQRQHAQLSQGLSDLSSQITDLHSELLEVKRLVLDHRHLAAQAAVHPSQSRMANTPVEQEAVRKLLRRLRELPAAAQAEFVASPSLSDMGQAAYMVGENADAKTLFDEVAATAPAAAERALARHNAFRAAVEQRDAAGALAEIKALAELGEAGRAYAPFPLRKYEPLAFLGAGAFGVVFRCRDRHLGAEVAIKALHIENLEQSLDKVFRDARALAGLHNEAIIAVTHCDYVDDQPQRPYIVMEYFDGNSLAAELAAGPLPPQDAIAIAQQVAQGMQAAHERGIFHRDLKPDNIMVKRVAANATRSRDLTGRGSDGSDADEIRPAWQVKIIDFGLAQRPAAVAQSVSQAPNASPAERSTTQESGVGTWLYAPPEQMGLSTAPIGPWSDVYAFSKTLAYVLFKDTDPLREDLDGLPRPLAELIEKGKAKDHKRRPQSMAEVLKTIESLAPAPSSSSRAPEASKQTRADPSPELPDPDPEHAALQAEIAAERRRQEAARIVREEKEQAQAKRTAEEQRAREEAERAEAKRRAEEQRAREDKRRIDAMRAKQGLPTSATPSHPRSFLSIMTSMSTSRNYWFHPATLGCNLLLFLLVLGVGCVVWIGGVEDQDVSPVVYFIAWSITMMIIWGIPFVMFNLIGLAAASYMKLSAIDSNDRR